MSLVRELNRLAGTAGLEAAGAANAIAGTSGLEVVGALNVKAGTRGLELNGVCRELARQFGGDSTKDGVGALRSIDAFLDPLLAEAVVLFRASEFTGSDGDDWVNEGTGGAEYDAVADPASTAGDPHFVTSPSLGFEMGGSGDPPNYQAPNGSAIDADTGSFTVMARILYHGPDEAFAPIIAKITGTPGVDAHGWLMATGTALGPGVGFLISNGTPTLATAIDADELVADTEYLLVGRVDRTGDSIDLFVDGVEGATAAAAGVTDVTSTNPIIMSRSTTAEQTGRAYAYWARALTDQEIASLSDLFP